MFRVIKSVDELTPDEKRYITVYEPICGYKAIHLWATQPA